MIEPRGRLLLVDADRALRDSLAKYLEGQGYACAGAEDGEDALAMIEMFTPDLVITDRALRRMSGDELCRRLRAHPKTAGCPVILLTATDPINATVGFDVAPEDYICKPFSVGLLLSRIEANRHGLAVA
jgi:DNA-binding response OmpR family regulator